MSRFVLAVVARSVGRLGTNDRPALDMLAHVLKPAMQARGSMRPLASRRLLTGLDLEL